MTEISDTARENVDRWLRQSDEFQKRAHTAIELLPVEELRMLAHLYVENVGYLGEHLPEERVNEPRYACTGHNWHRCSLGVDHQQGCTAIDGDGVLVNPHSDRCVSCEPTCDSDSADEPWCHCSGFDCPDCATVDELLALFRRNEVPA